MAGPSSSRSASSTTPTVPAHAPQRGVEDPTACRPNLGDYTVVEDLLRGYFFGGILQRAIALGEGRLTHAQAGNEHVAVCCYLARVFSGQAPEDYTSAGRWHEGDGPGTLAALVRQRLAGSVAPHHLQAKESALQCLFALAATDMFTAIHRFTADGDAEALRECTLELTKGLTRLLLGLPGEG